MRIRLKLVPPMIGNEESRIGHNWRLAAGVRGYKKPIAARLNRLLVSAFFLFFLPFFFFSVFLSYAFRGGGGGTQTKKRGGRSDVG